MRLALYQPDIPQNTGTLLRLSACLSVPVDIIEPCGFTFTARELRRSLMDYAELAEFIRHDSWQSFLDHYRSNLSQPDKKRLVLLTTRADCAYTDFQFEADDILLLGRESAGVPDEVHDVVDRKVLIPMHPAARSINVAVAGAMVLGEAIRQTGHDPKQFSSTDA